MAPNDVGYIPAPKVANFEGIADEEIVTRVRDGEIAAFEILMRRHNQRLYRVARGILGDDSEAEDVMQEAYVRAFSHLGQFENRAKFSTWLTKIAVYEALARLRNFRRVESLDAGADSETNAEREPMSSAQSPEQQLIAAQMNGLLEAAISGLPDRYRLVFVLREIEEMSTAETAESLGVSEEVVKTRLHRARAMLQSDLYARVGSNATEAFDFHLSRCNRVVNAVLGKIMLMAPLPGHVQ